MRIVDSTIAMSGSTAQLTYDRTTGFLTKDSQDKIEINSSSSVNSSNVPKDKLELSKEGIYISGLRRKNKDEINFEANDTTLQNKNGKNVNELNNNTITPIEDTYKLNSKDELRLCVLESILSILTNSNYSFKELNSHLLEVAISELSTKTSNSTHTGKTTANNHTFKNSTETEENSKEDIYITKLLPGQSESCDNQAAIGYFEINEIENNNGTIEISNEQYEKEILGFKAKMAIETANGDNIHIKIGIKVSREFAKKIDGSTFEKKLVDPLVVNFGSVSADLTSTKFSFDLDCNGTSDQISSLAKGSGFLALDKNNDGIINDGSELFGAKSGDGFVDLAAYDRDNNSWIDENDDIFDKLRIWTKDENGQDQLVGIGEKGIGAIYLGNVKTDYSLKSEATLNGMIRETGVFLRNDFSAGTIQHIDFVV